ncbi:MAG TPA: helix-turn-helix transcriptional regulator [Anaerolineae bacterium]|jgi:DNA-binding NarL/FixJ family response regulator
MLTIDWPALWPLILFNLFLFLLWWLVLRSGQRLVRRWRAAREAHATVKTADIHLIEQIQPTPQNTREWIWGNLTDREMQVARLTARGLKNSEIADELTIAPRTVETHLKSIYAKLDVHSRAQLASHIRDLVD